MGFERRSLCQDSREISLNSDGFQLTAGNALFLQRMEKKVMGEVNWVWGGLNFSFTGRSRSGLGLSCLCTAMFCQFLWIHLVCFCTAVHRERKHHSTLIALPLTPAMRKKIPTSPWNQIRFCLNEIKVVDLYPLGIYIYISSEEPFLIYSKDYLQLFA